MEKTAQFDIEKAKTEIECRLRDYENAMANGDIELFANLYTEDAEIFHDGRPSTLGREEILKNFEGWYVTVLLEALKPPVYGEMRTYL